MPSPPTTTAVVTLPFPVSRLQDPPAGLTYNEFREGMDPEVLRTTTFWVTPYTAKLDYQHLIPRMEHLQVIQSQSAGVDDIAPWVPAGTTLCNARGVHDPATAEMGVALILASIRQLPRFVKAQAERVWDSDNAGPSLADRHVVIVGFGSIGQALARRLEGFECTVTGVTRSGRDGSVPMTELPRLLPTADVVVLLTPLNDDTHHLVDAAFLARMHDGALLVNLSRGPVVDTDALLAEAGRISAALDVTDPEPLPGDHPLWTAPSVLITPHSAGGTTAMLSRVDRLVEAQLARYVAGEPQLNVIQL
ncbi:2-hydroxyacid dehydrogenase [Nocardioides sp. Root151]|uniref:2-hydroxyacid dehydrogenase n=1 Tax=Nocardioides sp. Root151 TaxID=1736475 RepID=UPI000703121B|nr:2-hydroxyacid dehydrogenase [Nocardioides sp. Root151]KQZ70681.1 hypothetical protein ASD66_13975 [Nocardioides sp. Root151]